MSSRMTSEKLASIHDGKTNFGKDSPYLQDNFVIDLRRDVARMVLAGESYAKVIDIGCGDGSISIEFMTDARIARMVDVSPEMLEAARMNLQKKSMKHVEIFCYNFEEENNQIELDRYDLIVCTGVFAHVRDYLHVLHKLIAIAEKSSLVVLQNTDARHPYTVINEAIKSISGLFGVAPRRHNEVRTSTVIENMKRAGFELIFQYNYISSFPLIGRCLSGKTKYNINGRLFPPGKSGMLSCLGNESLLFFKRH
jgi:ubiquinone/menaquinone biosynthesis C-methylase UbiE